MSLQNTISMTLDIFTKFECVYCNRSNHKSGFFTILKEGGIQLFCSKECADYDKKRKQKLICAHCGKSFENLTNGYKRKYCSNTCNVNGHYSRYQKFNWCGMCNEWIRKEDSIIKKAGTIMHYKNSTYKSKKDNQFCPICRNRLRVRKYRNAERRTRNSNKEE